MAFKRLYRIWIRTAEKYPNIGELLCLKLKLLRLKICLTQLFILSCLGQNDYCCTKDTPCGAGQGDCDYHYECLGHLTCGTNNCPSGGFLWDSGDDCCYDANCQGRLEGKVIHGHKRVG